MRYRTIVADPALCPDIERHDATEPAVCVGQWCCGCSEHPRGKPWGWNHEAWETHYHDCPNMDGEEA